MTLEADAIGVLIVDDDPLVRAGLMMMLDGAAGIRVVAQAGDGTQVLPLVDRHAPDVVLMTSACPRWTAWRPPKPCAPAATRRRSSS
jgi:DNA-binding NarL/FixJ family response regulator